MYIGSTKRANAGDIFDGMIWVAHWFWASVQSREKDFRDVVSAVRESYKCSGQDFQTPTDATILIPMKKHCLNMSGNVGLK